MAEIHDFSRLYRQLGLEPGCSLHELRMAYRRNVARLHPDRNHGDGLALQQLNILYGAALDFQRHMGRLPGARAGERAPVARRRETAQHGADASPRRPPDEHREQATRLRTLALLLLALLLAALAWAAANQALGDSRASNVGMVFSALHDQTGSPRRSG